MSKDKEVVETPTVGVSVDDSVSDDSMFDEQIKWDDLVLAKDDAVKAVLNGQQLVLELAEMKSEVINSDKHIFGIVDGLTKTYKDLANDIRVIALEHASVTTDVKTPTGALEVAKSFKSGVITGNDDELKYIAIATNYISIAEKVGHITGTTYPDILLKLGMSNDGIAEAYDEGSKTTEGVSDAK